MALSKTTGKPVVKKAAAKKKPLVKATLGTPGTVIVNTNGSTAAHEMAALKLLEAEGYDLTEWAVCDYDSYGDGPSYTFEKVN